MIATARGLGRLLPEDARLSHDPYGERFGTARLRWWLSRGLFQSLLLTVQVRTKLLDEAVLSFVRAGGRQVVLLGAGFDARAHRLAELQGVRVFEVDHPATQERKRAVLPEGANVVTYVPFDFENEQTSALPDALRAAGHDPRAPTFTLWEGVTMYLSEPAVDATVRSVASWSCAGSPFVFTYLERASVKSPSLAQRIVAWLVAGASEPLTFGFVADELPAWLAARGVTVNHDVRVSDAAKLLMPERFHARFVDRSLHAVFAARA